MSVTNTTVGHQHLWHPFAKMPEAVDREIVIEKGMGSQVWDSDGKEYLDAMASLWYCSVGHGRSEIAEVARNQMSSLAGYHTFDSISNRPALDLSERICALAPLPEPCAAFLTSGGSDSVETAGKIARRYWNLRGEPSRRTIVSRKNSYHGMHAYGTSLAGIEVNGSGWGMLITDVRTVPMDDIEELEELFLQEGSTIAAFIGEPVVGAGGVYPPADGYWAAVRDLCREHDVLLIADEVITGFGRLGKWFGSEVYDIEPDMIVTAKGISSGYAPVGAVLAGPRILEVLWADDAPMFRHGYTYSGHPVGCAVALANLDIIENEDLLTQVDLRADELTNHLTEISSHSLVREVRSAGLLGAVELDVELLAKSSMSLDDVVMNARGHGLLTRGLLGRALQISPPFVTSEDELKEMLVRIEAALDTTQEQVG